MRLFMLLPQLGSRSLGSLSFADKGVPRCVTSRGRSFSHKLQGKDKILRYG